MFNFGEFRMKRLLVNIGLLLLLLSASSMVVFADGGHGGEDEAVVDDGHDDEGGGFAMMPLILGMGAAVVVSGGAYATDKKRFSNVQLATLGLTVVTGVLHLVMGFSGDTLLLVNGLGYLALSLAFFLPGSLFNSAQLPLLVVLAVYTLITIVGYFVLHSSAQFTAFALLTKAVEVVLLVCVGLQVSQRQSA